MKKIMLIMIIMSILTVGAGFARGQQDKAEDASSST